MSENCQACAEVGIVAPVEGVVSSIRGNVALCRDCLNAVRGNIFAENLDLNALDARARLAVVFALVSPVAKGGE